MKKEKPKPKQELPTDMYVDLILTRRRENMWWRIVTLVLSLCVFVLTISLVYMAQRNAIKPYVVPVNGLDKEIQAFIELKPLKETRQIEAVVIEFLREYLRDFRSIIPDYDTLKANIDFVKSSTSKAVLKSTILPILNTENPFELSKTLSRSVHIESILPKQGNTYILTWKETEWNKNGDLIGTHEYVAFVTISLTPPSTLSQIRKLNPLGIDVVEIRYEETHKKN